MRSFGLITALLVTACGAPELKMPKPLDVVFLPEDGLIDVDITVKPRIYFSGEVDPDSITAESVLLGSASLDVGWNTVTTTAAVDSTQPQIVEVVPAADLLHDTSYELIITTEVRGKFLAQLPDIGVPDRPGIGAICHFRTN